MADVEFDRYSELAHFLRSRRERLTPEQAGISGFGRRRTPGLRRTEVAMLAGVSLEWYTYLEQARPINVSIEVLESVARALQLNSAERKHMFLLAHRQSPPQQEKPQTRVSLELQRLIDSMEYTPASIMDTKMNIIARNQANFIFEENKLTPDEHDDNFLWITFTSDFFRTLKGEHWEQHAHMIMAQFRSNYAQYADDPWWKKQVEQLSMISSEFQRMWAKHDVVDAFNMMKEVYHPVVGVLNFDHLSVHPSQAPDLQINMHVPHNDGTVDKIKQLLQIQNKC
ncbi:helix-turn-helix transcriptional regulator [Paenibacillus sp. WLX1005]|uniref:helix-turn-helix transcriptional regulator n=1 Tax=Paenibacillus sp. WLX1005 TaxID=3243766 RepID=UPI0039840456